MIGPVARVSLIGGSDDRHTMPQMFHVSFIAALSKVSSIEDHKMSTLLATILVQLLSATPDASITQANGCLNFDLLPEHARLIKTLPAIEGIRLMIKDNPDMGYDICIKRAIK